jgi:uncharacterized protein
MLILLHDSFRKMDQIEIDYIEESDGVIHSYEFKWNPQTKVKRTKTFSGAYPESTFNVIHRDNFEEFIM